MSDLAGSNDLNNRCRVYGASGNEKRDESNLWPQLSNYRIVREIARGGMGIVYEAEQLSLGRQVALKTLATDRNLGPNAEKRFQMEARSASRLHHSNIVPVFEVGHEAGTSFYAMQYIGGMGLDQVTRRVGELLDSTWNCMRFERRLNGAARLVTKIGWNQRQRGWARNRQSGLAAGPGSTSTPKNESMSSDPFDMM